MTRLSYRFVGAALLSVILLVGLYQVGLSSSEFSIAGRILKPHNTPQDSLVAEPEPEEDLIIEEGKANAVILMLVRNRELEGALKSMRQLEDKFNHRYNYPWVFLNEEPFTEYFKEEISAVTNASVSFGLIPYDDWFQPDWIDEEKASKAREEMRKQKVIYGDSVSYRNMCRFNSQQFYKHELLLPYRWYWRVEPQVSFTCEVDFDPFAYMQNNDKIYGFTIALYEFNSTIPTLWSTVKEFINQNPQFVSPDNAMGFISDNGGEDYNLCHFWSNFEIADMRFWRGEAYTAFTKHLDSKGGYYYERWGDAPVHSMGVSLFARKDQIHFFDDIGYGHAPFSHCPKRSEVRNSKCSCRPLSNFDFNGYSCYPRWRTLAGE